LPPSDNRSELWRWCRDRLVDDEGIVALGGAGAIAVDLPVEAGEHAPRWNVLLGVVAVPG
jgi:hypothetical protein